MYILVLLKFTPLEFKTGRVFVIDVEKLELKFTPLEFKTKRG